jgi:hypothetical protein
MVHGVGHACCRTVEIAGHIGPQRIIGISGVGFVFQGKDTVLSGQGRIFQLVVVTSLREEGGEDEKRKGAPAK